MASQPPPELPPQPSTSPAEIEPPGHDIDVPDTEAPASTPDPAPAGPANPSA